MWRLHRALLAGIWLILAPGSACSRETITVAAEDDWPPYSSIKADKSGPEGFSSELVRAVFDLKDIDVKFLTVPFARCLLYARTGRAVGCFNTSRVAENQDEFYWHPTPLFSEGLALFVRSDRAYGYQEIKDLEGRSVGVTIGYTYSLDLTRNPRITLVRATSDAHQLQMLLAGRIEYALLNTMPAYLRINRDPGLRGRIRLAGTLAEDAFWLAFSRRHPDGQRLSVLFEEGLQELRASGRYDIMLRNFRKRVGAD